ncbi:MAG: GFA family protein [Rhodospirillales bacterium]|nr:GFA family protein [Rhodospirillales bacterium]MDP6643375.1 GFA family protein [Rhodospirillales bacterium]MDP6840623.1 GFA family protein [Rhodospirillales bacterium]
MPPPYTGGCQCGAIRYEFSCEPLTVYTCHCTDCQKTAASAFGMSVRVKAENFTLTKGEPNSIDIVADSGRTKTGLFCGDCGTRVCNKPGANGPQVVVKAGTLDDPNWFRPIAHIWTRSAQGWFPFADGLPKFETAPEDPAALNELWDAHVAGG